MTTKLNETNTTLNRLFRDEKKIQIYFQLSICRGNFICEKPYKSKMNINW